MSAKRHHHCLLNVAKLYDITDRSQLTLYRFWHFNYTSVLTKTSVILNFESYPIYFSIALLLSTTTKNILTGLITDLSKRNFNWCSGQTSAFQQMIIYGWVDSKYSNKKKNTPKNNQHITCLP